MCGKVLILSRRKVRTMSGVKPKAMHMPSNQRGSVEKSRQRRSRQFSVLTYGLYALRAKRAAAFPSASLRTGLDERF